MTEEELDDRLLEICNSREDRSKELKMLIILACDYFVNYNRLIVLCCSVKNLEHIKVLVKSNVVHVNNVLTHASWEGYLDGVKYAVENGAVVHGGDDMALRISSDRGHLEVVKILVENGADVHAQDGCALRWAQENEHDDVVEYLKSLSE